MSHAPRVLFYSHNGVGVGHFRRQLKLAGALRARVPGAVVLMVTGSHTVEALNGPFGFECVSLPSIRMLDRYENWEPRRLGLSRRDLMRQRADLLRRTVRHFRPDVLLADFMPAGPYGELVGALEELQRAGGRAVAGFRDIVDEPAFVADLWRRTGVLDVLREYYSAIWVYGTQGVLDYAADYGVDGELAARTCYLGYLAPTPPARALPASAAPAITACTGGGVDGGLLLGRFIEAMAQFAPPGRGRPVVVGGPLLSEAELGRLRELASGTGIEVRRFLSGLDGRIAASDLVVTMPGYNTTCELLASEARAIVVPRTGPSLEQRLRADALVRWGRASSLEAGALAPHVLAEAIESALAAPAPPAAPVPLDGLARAGDAFASLLSAQPAAGGAA